MKERPILFSGPMVRAILDGRKTQTRRVMKPQPSGVDDTDYCDPYNHNYDAFTFWTHDDKMILSCGGDRKNMAHWRSPYGAPGDRLWVRETFWRQPGEALPGLKLIYKADNPDFMDGRTNPMTKRFYKWRPSIHMPRWASRITLEVTDVRVDRLKDITDDDCDKEGFAAERHRVAELVENWSYGNAKMPDMEGKGVDWFHNLWDSINAKRGYGWSTNPWVWVVEFRRHEETP